MTDENKNEEKNGFEQLAAFFNEAITTIVDNLSENFREAYEEISKEYSLQRKVRNKEQAEENGETLEKIALYNEEENLHLKLSIYRNKTTGEIRDIYTVLQAKEDYDIDNELDFRAGFPSPQQKSKHAAQNAASTTRKATNNETRRTHLHP